MSEAKKTKNPPVARVRVNNLTAAIWAQSSDGKTFYSHTTQRSYRDNDGNWKNTSSINDASTPAFILLGHLVYAKIQELKAADVSDKPTDEYVPESEEGEDIVVF